MPDINIHRDHALGLAKARELAAQWAKDAENTFQMACTIVSGEAGDTVAFTRSGISGELVAGADHFELSVKLGLMLGAFRKTIEAEIEKNFDQLLAGKKK